MPSVGTERSAECLALAGIADGDSAERLNREMSKFFSARRISIVSSFDLLVESASRSFPRVVLLDGSLLPSTPLLGPVRRLIQCAPVVLVAPVERQPEIPALIAGGDLEFVARAGDYIPIAAGLLERRLRWALRAEWEPTSPWNDGAGDLAEIFRHEINNPLTGILGNAELVLAHRERLHSIDVQRLQTVVELAVKLRETVRRLSNSCEMRVSSL